MNPKQLEENYQNKKQSFHSYIDKIKLNSKWDIYTIINPTLVKNPYASEFPKNYFLGENKSHNKIVCFIKNSLKYYVKNFYLFFSYLVANILYKIYYKKIRHNNIKIIIDTFGIVDKTKKEKKFSENYLTGIYEIFEKYNSDYTILLRPYQVGKNPFKLVKFFKIISKDKRDFIFEYELFGYKDFFILLKLILYYPFKTLRLLQKENSYEDKVFNNALIADINNFSFDSLSRYILGKNISKIDTLEKIYSWSEFQVIERSFNYAIRKSNSNIELIALQFYLNYETYFNAYVDDLDYDMLSSPHKVLVNGKYYIQQREKVIYDTGVSLRYKKIFDFEGIKEEKNILLLGSYIENDTKYMLESVKDFENIIFKNHPAVDIKKFGILPKNITVSNENIYKLFENAKLVIGTASGTCVEAVVCGISVIVIASQDNFTANPLVEMGKGKIWDIAFDKNEIKDIYDKLMKYRKSNMKEIEKIANWYKEKFFSPLSNDNIIKTFGFKYGN